MQLAHAATSCRPLPQTAKSQQVQQGTWLRYAAPRHADAAVPGRRLQPSHAFGQIATLATSEPLVQAATADVATKQGGGWLAPLTDTLETLLKFFSGGLDTLHVPYSYGWSIILLTLTVKALTFPLTKQQVESQLAVQSLKPRLELIKARYGEDKDRISKETSLLYEAAGVNPLAGCLPTIATIPIFIGLYSSLTNVASEGLLDTQGFFWLPSLAGPTSIAARKAGTGLDWLFPFVDGAPAIGWEQGAAYLSMPILLIIVQYLSTAVISTPVEKDDPNYNTTTALNALLPLMVGYFALNVPSGLSLYYVSNSALTLAVQLYLRKLGGAKINVKDLGPVTKPGSGRRLGPVAVDFVAWESEVERRMAEAKAKDLAAEEDEDDLAATLAHVQQPEVSQAQQAAGKVLFAKRVRLDKLEKAGQLPVSSKDAARELVGKS